MQVEHRETYTVITSLETVPSRKHYSGSYQPERLELIWTRIRPDSWEFEMARLQGPTILLSGLPGNRIKKEAFFIEKSAPDYVRELIEAHKPKENLDEGE